MIRVRAKTEGRWRGRSGERGVERERRVGRKTMWLWADMGNGRILRRSAGDGGWDIWLMDSGSGAMYYLARKTCFSAECVRARK
jgi:hypothetical protein